MTIEEIRRHLAELHAQRRALMDAAAAEGRQNLNAEETTRWDELSQRYNDTNAHLQRMEALAAEETRNAAPAAPAERGTPGETENRGHAPAGAIVPGGMSLEAQGYRHMGEFLRDVYLAGLRNAETPPRLMAIQQAEIRAATGAGEAVPSDGGFLVATDMSSVFMQRAYEQSILANRCTPIPIGAPFNGTVINGIDETSRATGSRWGGVQSYWVGEGVAGTASRPRFSRIELKLNKLMALYYATDEVLQDSTQLETVANVVFPGELAFRIDEAVLRGTGAGQPLGILNSPALVSQAKESNQAADTIVWDNVKKMWSRMWAPSRLNAVWLINQDIEPQLYGMTQIVGTGGVPVYLPPGGASAAPYATLMSRPVIPVEQASTLGDQGDINLVDLTQYLLARKGGVQYATSIHVQFLADEQVYRWIVRVDGQPNVKSALTPYSGGPSLSSFVTLDARA